MHRILFVCHGNICRSPAAMMIAHDLVKRRGLLEEAEVTSFATSYEEIGNGLYPPMERALRAKGIPVLPHEARHIGAKDIAAADEVYYMDEWNRRNLIRMFGEKSNVYPVFRYVSKYDEIEDPWYTGRYDYVVDQLIECVTAILDEVFPS